MAVLPIPIPVQNFWWDKDNNVLKWTKATEAEMSSGAYVLESSDSAGVWANLTTINHDDISGTIGSYLDLGGNPNRLYRIKKTTSGSISSAWIGTGVWYEDTTDKCYVQLYVKDAMLGVINNVSMEVSMNILSTVESVVYKNQTTVPNTKTSFSLSPDEEDSGLLILPLIPSANITNGGSAVNYNFKITGENINISISDKTVPTQESAFLLDLLEINKMASQISDWFKPWTWPGHVVDTVFNPEDPPPMPGGLGSAQGSSGMPGRGYGNPGGSTGSGYFPGGNYSAPGDIEHLEEIQRAYEEEGQGFDWGNPGAYWDLVGKYGAPVVDWLSNPDNAQLLEFGGGLMNYYQGAQESAALGALRGAETDIYKERLEGMRAARPKMTSAIKDYKPLYSGDEMRVMSDTAMQSIRDMTPLDSSQQFNYSNGNQGIVSEILGYNYPTGKTGGVMHQGGREGGLVDKYANQYRGAGTQSLAEYLPHTQEPKDLSMDTAFQDRLDKMRQFMEWQNQNAVKIQQPEEPTMPPIEEPPVIPEPPVPPTPPVGEKTPYDITAYSKLAGITPQSVTDMGGVGSGGMFSGDMGGNLYNKLDFGQSWLDYKEKMNQGSQQRGSNYFQDLLSETAQGINPDIDFKYGGEYDSDFYNQVMSGAQDTMKNWMPESNTQLPGNPPGPPTGQGNGITGKMGGVMYINGVPQTQAGYTLPNGQELPGNPPGPPTGQGNPYELIPDDRGMGLGVKILQDPRADNPEFWNTRVGETFHPFLSPPPPGDAFSKENDVVVNQAIPQLLSAYPGINEELRPYLEDYYTQKGYGQGGTFDWENNYWGNQNQSLGRPAQSPSMSSILGNTTNINRKFI